MVHGESVCAPLASSSTTKAARKYHAPTNVTMRGSDRVDAKLARPTSSCHRPGSIHSCSGAEGRYGGHAEICMRVARLSASAIKRSRIGIYNCEVQTKRRCKDTPIEVPMAGAILPRDKAPGSGEERGADGGGDNQVVARRV